MFREAVFGLILAFLVTCIILQEKRFEELDSAHSHLWNRVEDLTQANQNLSNIVHERKFKELELSHTHLLETVANLTLANTNLSKIVQGRRFKELELSHTHLLETVANLTLANRNLSKIVQDSSNKVAFTAGTSGAGNIGTGSIIAFPVVINNEGGGYNPGTGVFTAPRSGQYVFFVSAQGYGSNTLYVSIIHNGGAKVMTMSDGGRGKDFYDSGTNLAALNLQQGDTVWAKCQSGSSYYSEGIPITTFSGFLI
uniref:C1q domain-containing protein n=1 Tax=Magallana gigas TaxID=29159 RepID=A0A8W8JBC7_MAGGI|nr:uncharacterized protein LOC105330774 isoform X1 [Crassostrea gigas]